MKLSTIKQGVSGMPDMVKPASHTGFMSALGVRPVPKHQCIPPATGLGCRPEETQQLPWKEKTLLLGWGRSWH